MKFYSIDVSNYGNIVKQTLMEMGIGFDVQATPPNQEAGFLEISPMGKIPAVETADGPLCETRAILRYIADSNPGNPLFPADPYRAAKQEELFSLVDLYVEAPARRQLGEVMVGAPRDESTYAEVKPAVERGMRALRQRFSPSPYALGEFSVADIYLFHCLGLARTLMQSSYDWDIFDEIPGMSAWFEQVEGRDITRRVLADQAEAIRAMRARRG